MNYVPGIFCDWVEGGPKPAAAWLAWALCTWCWAWMKSHFCEASAKCNAGSKSGLLTFTSSSVDKCDTTLWTQAWLLYSVCAFWIGLCGPVSLLSSHNLNNKMEVALFCLHPLSAPPTFFPLTKIRLHGHILIIWVERKAELRHLHVAHFIWMLSRGSPSVGRKRWSWGTSQHTYSLLFDISSQVEKLSLFHLLPAYNFQLHCIITRSGQRHHCGTQPHGLLPL